MRYIYIFSSIIDITSTKKQSEEVSMKLELPKSVEFIFGYIRRSRQDIIREKKTDQDTLAEQRALMTDVLNNIQENYGIPYTLKEEIRSGGDEIASRPVFSSILEELKNVKPKTAAIAVKDITRLGRGDPDQMGLVLKLFKRKCVYIITPYQIYNPLNPNDERILKFYMFMGNIELDMIKQRMKEARYTYARQGRHMGGAAAIPYGYRLDSYTQKLVPIPEQAEVVRRIFHLYVNERIGYNGISTILKKEQIPTPTGKRHWAPVVIRRILTNDAYIGTYRFRQTTKIDGEIQKVDEEEQIIVENAWEPIVDEEIFYKAQEILKENRNKPSVKLEFEPNVLAGLIVCSGCGKKMVRQYSVQYYTKKDGTKSKYEKEFMMCLGCSVYIKYWDIERSLIQILKDNIIEINPDELKEKLRELIDFERVNNKKHSPQEQLNKVRTELERLEKQLDGITLMRASGEMDEDRYKRLREQVEEQIQEKKLYIEELSQQIENEGIEELDIKNIQQEMATLLDYYENGNLSKKAKNELLRGIFDYVVLTKTGKGKFDLDVMFNPRIFYNSFLS